MSDRWVQLRDGLRRSLARPGVAPEVVDDLVQDAAERLLRGLPGLRDEERVGPYVGRVVRSVWVDHLRRMRPTHGPDPDELAAEEAEEADLAPLVAAWLPRIVDGLPEVYREAVRLSELEGWTQRQVADHLGLSASGARTRIQRGRRLLRAELEACCRVEREGTRIVDVIPNPGCC